MTNTLRYLVDNGIGRLRITNQTFTEESLSNQNKTAISCVFIQIVFQKCKFENFDFTATAFSQCDLQDCRFSGAGLREINVYQCNFEKCTFLQSRLNDAEISETTFQSCFFQETDFSKADISDSQFGNCQFQNMDIGGLCPIISDSKFLNPGQEIILNGGFELISTLLNYFFLIKGNINFLE